MFITALLCVAAVGCSPAVEAPTQTVLTVFVQASAEAGPSTTQLDTARQVVETRLSILLEPDPEVTVSEGGLRVTAVDTPETRMMLEGSIEPGFFILLDSASSLPTGSIAPKDALVILTGDNIIDAEAVPTEAGGWLVVVDLDNEATATMAQFSTQNLGHYLILAEDNQVVNSLRLEAAILDGRAAIVGIDQSVARIIAAQMESGSLPLGLTLAIEP
jgi:preprotein translocase subunit SecD